jgi:hypothetical protein
MKLKDIVRNPIFLGVRLSPVRIVSRSELRNGVSTSLNCKRLILE